ncbi:hypothetical protein MHU86_25083 [Fragilaria crotonensis]|nr:hypothetical protein MHU86_25083 [Fragilaria crotonensis]
MARAYLDDEGRLQIRLQTNPSQSSHSHEVLHEYRRPAVSGAEDDVRWSAKPIAMERRVGDDHGLGKRSCPQGRLGSSVYHSPHQHLLDTEGQWTMTKATPPTSSLTQDTLWEGYTRPASVEAGREGETDQTPTGRPDSVEGFPSEGVARYLDQQAGLPVADAHSEGGRMPTRHRRLLPQERPGVAISATRAPAGAATLNTLEFLAAFVGMIVEFHEGAAWTDEDVLLSQGDSTSAAGWLAKSNFNDDCPLHLTIARAFADFCLTHEIDHYTQWFPGKENKLALLRKILGRIDGVGEPFLQGLGREAKAETFACFAAALRDGRLRSRQPQEAGNGPLSGSIRATLDSVAQAFRLNKFESPIHDAAGRLDPLLALQLKRYADEDPGPTPQQALPLEVIRKVRSWARNETDIAIGQLVVVAFFFAMRSCEYSDVGSRRTTSVIRVDDVRFRQKGQDLQTTDRGQLENADTVSITFRRQRTGTKARQ